MLNPKFRKIALMLVQLPLIAFAVSFAQGALGSLGVKEDEAKRQTVWSVTSGRVPISLAAKAFKAADSSARTSLVQGALAWIKAYTESPAFKADYEKQRMADKPAPPKARDSIDNELAKQKAERNKNLDEMRKNVAKMPPDMRPKMEATVKQMEEMYAKQDANPQMASMMRQNLEAQRAAEDKAFQDRVAQHEKRYPADPRILIAQRLQAFLDASKDVDFNAQLYAAEQGKKKFVNAAYESKPENWKICYRAGKPAVDAARTFAAAWLKEIQGK